MNRWWIVFVLTACGGKQQPSPHDRDPEPAGSAAQPAIQDTRTPLEKRRDAACDVVGKRSAACAVEDTRRDFAAGKVSRDQLALDTKPEVVAKLSGEYADKCKAHQDYSSRQIRVLEKCPQYETECEPFLKCLENVQPPNK
jgi:hypothetical protein